MMNELSLFSGAGGGLLASKYLLGWRTIGYVEYDDYCQRVIAQRIKDGLLDDAPIFGDIRSFISEGYAAGYTGLVDVVSGGFPCQPFSVAGKRKGKDDERNMWPATIEVIRIVRPRYAFLENVPGLLGATDGDPGERDMDDGPGDNLRYFGTILKDISEAGYDAEWTVLGADDVGGPHRRKRLWIRATKWITPHGEEKNPGPRGGHLTSQVKQLEMRNWPTVTVNDSRGSAYQYSQGNHDKIVLNLTGALRQWPTASSRDWRDPPGMALTGVNPDGTMRKRTDQLARAVYARQRPTPSAPGGDNHQAGSVQEVGKGQLNPDWVEWLMGWPIGWTSLEPLTEIVWLSWEIDPADGEEPERIPTARSSDWKNGGWFNLETRGDSLSGWAKYVKDPSTGPTPRTATGIKDRVNRLKALGNGQVPLCAATAWRILSE